MKHLSLGKFCRIGSKLFSWRFGAGTGLLALGIFCLGGCARSNYACSADCSASTSPAAASNIPDGFGVNIHFTEPRRGEIEMLSSAGFRWIRMDFKWDATEKEPGHYDFSAYDRLMDSIRPYNIRALFILDYGNPLYDGGAPPRTDASRQAFARWAIAAAKHFAGRGIMWEVYNEPNISTFWPPRPNVDEYVKLARAVGQAFRESAPNESLMGPATSEVDFDFIESCFKAGLLDYWSAVSVHAYRRGDPETATKDYCRLRALIDAYAADKSRGLKDEGRAKKDIPIISSEWGYSSRWRSIDDDKQGELLARSWLINLANGIPLSIWYDWHDDGADLNEPEHHFGAVSNSYYDHRDRVYDSKPAFLAAKTLTDFFNGYRFEKRLDVGSPNDYVLAFRKGNELRYATWTTMTHHRVRVPFKAGEYVRVRYTGDSSDNLEADQQGLSMELSTRPLYLK